MEEENLKSWRRLARNFQQTTFNSLGDRFYDKVNEEHLALKVGYALYGKPPEVNENDKTAAYSKTQQKHITLLCENIKSLQSPEDGLFYFSCIYIVFRLRNKNKDVGLEVLFKIPTFLNDTLSQEFFLDRKPRKYDTWDLYLQKNKLPKCNMCFPTKGVYSETNGSVDLTFASSNACNARTVIFNGLDVTSTVLLVGATGVSLASLAFPIATPVVWSAAATMLATGSYDTARKVYSLHDINKHGESLGFKNPDARSAWLNLAGSVVGMASVGTTAVVKSVIATESAISKAGIITLRVLNLSSLAVSGLGVVNGIVDLVLKHINGTLQTKDVVQFTYTCVFFLNAVVTYNTASQLIEGLASSDMKTTFDLRKNSPFELIKYVIECNDSNSLNILQKLIHGIQSKFLPEQNINDSVAMVAAVSSLLQQFLSKEIGDLQFILETVALFSNIWKVYQNVILNVIEEIKTTYGTPHWQSLVPRQVTTNLEIPRILCEEIDKVIETCCIEHHSIEHRNLITSSREFSINRADTDYEFISNLKFYCECIVAQYREEIEIYESCLDSKSAEQGFSRKEFDASYGIQGKRENLFFNRAIEKLNHPDFLENIDELYSKVKEGSQTVDNQFPFLVTTKSKIFTVCGPLNQNSLEDEFYWNKVSGVIGFKADSKNFVFIKIQNFVLIQPRTGHTSRELDQIKAILINTSFINECHMGLLILLSK